jgi:exodeoxyribonuclease-1
MQTFFWHDYETSGADSRRDRPLQFAGIRTTLELDVVGAPVMLYAKPARDALPHPDACLITGITPQVGEREGLIEAEFAARVHEQLAVPGTCTVGYNSLRFDDEFTRHMLYRNFYDPYAREWEHGNSRWDLIDLARLIRVRQPRLWEWYYALRRKQKVFELLDVVHMTPMVHVSSRYPASRGCLTVIAPLAQHPGRAGEIIVYDLASDPAEWLALDDDAIADRIFTPRADLPEGVTRIPLRTVRANHVPALAPLSVLQGGDTQRLQLDLDACLRHLETLRGAANLVAKVCRVFQRASALPPAEDPELALYGGDFLSAAERKSLALVRATPPGQLRECATAFRDPRYAELLFRYRARNWPDTLDVEETARWQAFCTARLTRHTALTNLTLDDYFTRIAELRSDPAAQNKLALLDQLQVWGEQLT